MIASSCFKNILMIVMISLISISYAVAQEAGNNAAATDELEVTDTEATPVGEAPAVKTPIKVETLTGDPEAEAMYRRIIMKDIETRPDQIPSMFFTSNEEKLLIDARAGLVTRLATDGEISRSERELREFEETGKRPARGPRELTLGGIVFTNSGDWTIWLNGQKITPKRLPPEILDIRVHKDFVKLKWFDGFTNQIFPIKLKTHQRFNIDTRIFLPG